MTAIEMALLVISVMSAGTVVALRMVRFAGAEHGPVPPRSDAVQDFVPSLPPAPRVPHDMIELEHELRMLEQAGQ